MELVHRLHRPVVEADNHITSLKASFRRWRIWHDVANQCPFGPLETKLLGNLRGDGLDEDPNVPPYDLALLYKLFHDTAGHVDGYGKPYSATAAKDSGIDTDDLAPEIQERAPRVARIDGGVGLNVVFVMGKADARATRGADYADRYRLVKPEGAPNGYRPLAYGGFV